MNIKPVEFKDIPQTVISQGKKNQLIFREGPNAHYFGGFIKDQLVCLTCLVINKNKTASIKSNFTLKQYRGQGLFTELNNHCLALARKLGVKRILLNCLKDSVNIHRKAGARVWKTTKNIFWMVYNF